MKRHLSGVATRSTLSPAAASTPRRLTFNSIWAISSGHCIERKSAPDPNAEGERAPPKGPGDSRYSGAQSEHRVAELRRRHQEALSEPQ